MMLGTLVRVKLRDALQQRIRTANLDLDAKREQRPIARNDVAERDEVLFRRQQQIGSTEDGHDLGPVLGPISMMVGKSQSMANLHTQLAQRAKESVWPGDTGHRHGRAPAQPIRRRRSLRNGANHAHDPTPDAYASIGVQRIPQHYVRTRNAAGRLAQRAGRQDARPFVGRWQQHHIQVAMEADPLKAVVQHDQIGSQLVYSKSAGKRSVSRGDHRAARTQCREQCLFPDMAMCVARVPAGAIRMHLANPVEVSDPSLSRFAPEVQRRGNDRWILAASPMTAADNHRA
jgi:hypothetical protein